MLTCQTVRHVIDQVPLPGRLDHFAYLQRLEARIAAVSREIEALASHDDVARRLMTIPGIGPLGATALMAAVGNGQQFGKARDLAAWLGLVPRQFSTVANRPCLAPASGGTVMCAAC
jgi:transposase